MFTSVQKNRSKLKVAGIYAIHFVLLSHVNLAAADADAESDYQARATHPDVVFATRFDTQSEVKDYILQRKDDRYDLITQDAAVKASGNGSLKYVIRQGSQSGSQADWRRNFTDDNSIQFGAGEAFFIQWRQRFSADFLAKVFKVIKGPGGWKQIIIGEGDKPGFSYGDAGEASSCSHLEIVVNNGNQKHFPQMYHSCNGFNPITTPYNATVEVDNQDIPISSFKLQNAIDNILGTTDAERFVLYKVEKNNVAAVRSDFPGVSYYPDEWMTFQIHVKLGPLGSAGSSIVNSGNTNVSGFTNSTIEMWVAREGEVAVKTHLKTGIVLRRKAGKADTGEKYGKFWLTMFHTQKDKTDVHPDYDIWYDEVIVSRSRIADPQVKISQFPPPNTTLPDAPTGVGFTITVD